MSADSALECEKLRTQGNVLYKQVSEGGFGFSIRRRKFYHAQELYNKALDQSPSSDDRASCYKNLGALIWAWTKAELEQIVIETGAFPSADQVAKLASCRQHLRESVEFCIKAKENGVIAGKPEEWLDQLDSVLISMVDWARGASFILLLRDLCDAFNELSLRSRPVNSEAVVLASKDYAEALLREGIRAISSEQMDYKRCLSLIRECNQPLQRAKGLLIHQQNKEALVQGVQDLEKRLHLYRCISESMQRVAFGDAALTKCMVKDEEVNMEQAWDAVDHYRAATQLAQEAGHLESEAVAMSRLGKVHSEVLRMHEKAQTYHLQSIRLALSLSSSGITSSDWYKYSCEKVKEHQERVVAEEEEEHKRARMPVLKRLQLKVEELCKQSKKSTESFLKFVYREHPHPDASKCLGALGAPDTTKATLKRAICHYHPDPNAKYGEEWKVLCEEITKSLNVKYLAYKGAAVI